MNNKEEKKLVKATEEFAKQNNIVWNKNVELMVLNAYREGSKNVSNLVKILEATERFEFIKERDGILIFWDNHWENEHSINANWDLKKLMQWLINFYSEDYLWRGKQNAQREMRIALGLE